MRLLVLGVSVALALSRVAGAAPTAPRRVATPMAVERSPATDGLWTAGPDGGRLWSLELGAPGAVWLGLGFDRVRLPEGARLVVRDRDGRQAAAYAARDVRPGGQLWVPPIAGDTVLVELFWPRDLWSQEPDLRLTTLTRGLVSWGGIGAGTRAATGDCNIDLSCSPEGDGWDDEGRGVVQMLVLNTGATCTGSLINTTANLATASPPFDQVYPAGMRCAPYLLTADHCFDAPPGGPAGTAESAVFLFNFAIDRSGACVAGVAPGIAPRSQTLTGATSVANYDPSDFRLLLLDSMPPREFGARLNGWNRSTTFPTGTTLIHHPVDTSPQVPVLLPKKITRDAGTLTNGQPPPDGFGNNHWRVADWDDGAPEPGSSGAPLFDANGRIVGQLHGGGQGCAGPGSDEFGKLSASWTGGGTVPTRLSSHLDPLATQVVTLDGIDLQTCLERAPGVVPIAEIVDDDAPSFGNGDGVADPGDVLRLAVDLFNGLAPGLTAVTATLSTASPKVAVLDGAAAWGDLGGLSHALSEVPHFGLEIDPTLVCGSAPVLQLDVTSAEGSWQSSFALRTGSPARTFYDDGDSAANGFFCAPGLCVAGEVWSGPAAWGHACEPSVCPDTSWFINDNVNNTNAALRAPSIRTGNLAAGSKLTFRHFMRAETGFDGGVLEFSTNEGATWLDAYSLILDGFYDATIDGASTSAIKTRPAWSGFFEGWRTVVVDLSSFAFQTGTLALRWRFVTDSGGASGDGWYVDDVEIVGGGFSCSAPASRHFPGAACRTGSPFPCGTREPKRGPGPTRRR